MHNSGLDARARDTESEGETMTAAMTDTDPWAGWAIDPRGAADFEIGDQCIL